MTIEVCHLDDLQSGELGPISIGVRDYAVDGARVLSRRWLDDTLCSSVSYSN